jgi:phosphate acetyltransferase
METPLYIENVLFDDLKIGQSVSLSKQLTEKDIQLFAVLSGDVNPAHLDTTFAKTMIFGGVVGHGMWSGALISSLLGTALPGPGTIYLNQNLDFKKPVRPGETLLVTITVKEKLPHKPIVSFDCLCTNTLGETVVSGTATVLAPTQKIRMERPVLPDVMINNHDRYRKLVNSCENLPPLKTAIVHPVNALSLKAAWEAAEEGLIEPVLVGPSQKIQQAAAEAGLDIQGFELIHTEHSHAAAQKAVELARMGGVESIMKGSLHSDELLSAVVSSSNGLRTERRVSHVYVMDVPTYHKLLVITDAAINIAPTLEEKADICRNAIDLWRTIHSTHDLPKVAILAATELINVKMQATTDAACLCKMADRGQIAQALLDGPLALDLAISLEAVQNKGLTSPVAGDADILLVPDINAGNMVAKQLTFLGRADAAGIVLGARVPIILTSRSDSLRARLMSCALAVRLAQARRMGQVK